MCALHMLLIKATYLLTYLCSLLQPSTARELSLRRKIALLHEWIYHLLENSAQMNLSVAGKVELLCIFCLYEEWNTGNKTTALDSIMLQQNWFRGVTVECISMTSDFYWLKWYCHFVIPCNWQPSVCERVILAQRRRHLLPCVDDDKAVITRWRHKELCTAPGLLSLASFSAGKRR